jgi:beta propeller repeat protein
LVAGIALLGAQSALGQLTFTEMNITNDGPDQDDASIWGDLIVYEDSSNPASDEIWMYDLSTGTKTRITNAGLDAWEPRIYGDKIAYQQYGVGGTNDDIFVYDLSTGTETPITSDTAAQGECAIHGTRVVWESNQNNPPDSYDVYAYDLVAGTTQLVAGGSAYQGYPDVFGERIVYEDYGDPQADADIYMHDLTDGTETKITDRDASTKWDEDQFDPRIWGDTVVWYDYRNPDIDVWAYDVSTGTEQRITDENATQEYPAVFRDFIAWSDERSNWNVYLHDLRDGQEYPITSSTEIQDYPDVWGNKTVWTDYRDTVGSQADIWMAESELELDRSGGLTRYETAAEISQNHFANAGTVVLATGAMFPDALSASGLAGCYGGPLLLTLPDQLMPQARDEITRLGATDVVIVGGEGAVSANVATALQGMGLNVSRIGGDDRFHTSTLIAEEVERLTGTQFEKTAFIARGDEFPDALAVSPLAYYNRFPILLTPPDALNEWTEAAIRDLDIETAVVAGGPGAVSADVKNAVDGVLTANGGGLSDRWAGPTRYETAVEVAQQGSNAYWAGNGFIGLAVGDNFPDALAGGCAAGREFGVLLLTPTDDLPAAAENFINDVENGVGWVEAFGGSDVVSDAVANEVLQLLP